jgi:hypothetical protein
VIHTTRKIKAQDNPKPDPETPERALWAAVLVQALMDLEAGQSDAKYWFRLQPEASGLDGICSVLGLDPHHVRKTALRGTYQIKGLKRFYARRTYGNRPDIGPGKISMATAADILGMSDKSIKKLIASGLLPAEKGLKSWIIDRADVEELREAGWIGKRKK